MKEPIEITKGTPPETSVNPSESENTMVDNVTDHASDSNATVQNSSVKDQQDCSEVEKNNNVNHSDENNGVVVSNSDTGFSNENKTSDSNSKSTEEAPPGESNVDSVIDKTNNVPLVNSQMHLGDNIPIEQSSSHSNPTDQVKTDSSNVLESSEETPDEGTTTESNVVIHESQSMPNSSSPVSQDQTHVEEQCTSSVNNVYSPAQAINTQTKISADVNGTHPVEEMKPQTVTSDDVCKVIEKTVAQQIVDDIVEKVVESSEAKHQVNDKKTEMSEDVKETKKDENDTKSKDEEKTFFSSKSPRSEDYDEVEKSDGSDSGIGSELIDETITKSSDSSSTSSDEFPTSRAGGSSGEGWATPCISFSEMSEDEFTGPPRLSMPTFDDLTRSPCDVFATESKERKEFPSGEENAAKENGAGHGKPSTSSLPPTSSAVPSGSQVLPCATSPQLTTQQESCSSAPSKEGSDTRGGVDSDEDIDISSIDDETTPTPKPAEVPSSLLSEIPSIPSTSRQTGFKSNLKRPAPLAPALADGAPPSAKKRRGITFDTVSVYYFPRMQGFTCVPSQGGSTLGMSVSHSHVQTFTLAQYAVEQRRVHQRMARSPHCSPESAGSISGCDSDSDEDEVLSDQDSDSSYTLQPVKIRQRRAMLRAAGVDKIDPSEKNECKQIRMSREYCGCACEGYCDPEICACALAGIKCQVDRQNFPCGCSRDCCANPKGRIEFNPVRVHSHYIQTIMRMKAQKREDEMSRLYDYQQFHSYHPTPPTPEFEPTSLSAYYPHHHPQYLASHHHHHHHHVTSDLLSNFELQTQMHSCYEPFNPELATLYNHLSSGSEKAQESLTELLPSSYTGDTFNSQSLPSDVYTDSSQAPAGYRYSGPETSDPFYARDSGSYPGDSGSFSAEPATTYPSVGFSRDPAAAVYAKNTLAPFPTTCGADYARSASSCSSGDFAREAAPCSTVCNDYTSAGNYTGDGNSCGSNYTAEATACSSNYTVGDNACSSNYTVDATACSSNYTVGTNACSSNYIAEGASSSNYTAEGNSCSSNYIAESTSCTSDYLGDATCQNEESTTVEAFSTVCTDTYATGYTQSCSTAGQSFTAVDFPAPGVEENISANDGLGSEAPGYMASSAASEKFSLGGHGVLEVPGELASSPAGAQGSPEASQQPAASQENSGGVVESTGIVEESVNA